MNFSPKDVPIPMKMQSLPRFNGVPVPYTFMWIRGKPDFRVVDNAKWSECVGLNLCAMCGRHLGAYKFFIGGPRSVENHLFFDPAMHRDCAKYALKVCPYMALTSKGYSEREKPEHPHGETKVVEAMVTERPTRMALAMTKRYRYVENGGQHFVEAGDWEEIQWFESGLEIE